MYIRRKSDISALSEYYTDEMLTSWRSRGGLRHTAKFCQVQGAGKLYAIHRVTSSSTGLSVLAYLLFFSHLKFVMENENCGKYAATCYATSFGVCVCVCFVESMIIVIAHPRQI